METIKAVVTGDIIKSTQIVVGHRNSLLESIGKIASEVAAVVPQNIEFFRGDSFQIVIDDPRNAMAVAVLLRTGLKAQTPPESESTWDARLSIGIGTISYYADKIVVSDGEAFHLSGRELDQIGKRRLTVKTKWAEVNDELRVSTAFADDIITSWSQVQSNAVYLTLLHNTKNKETAEILRTSPQNVSKLLNTSRFSLIQQYLERYNTLIDNALNKDT